MDQSSTHLILHPCRDCPGPISRRIIYDAHVKYVECEQVKGDPLLRPAQLEQFCTDVGAIMDASLPDDEE